MKKRYFIWISFILIFLVSSYILINSGIEKNNKEDPIEEKSDPPEVKIPNKSIESFLLENITLGEKIEILKSGESNKKIDLLFIPQGIQNLSIIEFKIKNLFYNPEESPEGKGLFKTAPFEDYASKFNIAYMDQNINETAFDVSFTKLPEGSTPQRLHFYFNTQKIKEKYAKFNPDYIIILFDSDYTSGGAEIQQLNLASSNYVWTFVHEFGHQFGGLADEYMLKNSPSYHCGNYIENNNKEEFVINLGNCFENYNKGLFYYPNLDVLGCPKWCEDYDISKLIEENEICMIYSNEEDCSTFREGICTWFETKHPDLDTHCVRSQGHEDIGINCIEGTQCLFGGDYGQLAFNPGGNSIMFGGTEFTMPSKNHLENILECCYPSKNTQECNEFKNKYKNIPDNVKVNPHFKIAYQKIVNCD